MPSGNNTTSGTRAQAAPASSSTRAPAPPASSNTRAPAAPASSNTRAPAAPANRSTGAPAASAAPAASSASAASSGAPPPPEPLSPELDREERNKDSRREKHFLKALSAGNTEYTYLVAFDQSTLAMKSELDRELGLDAQHALKPFSVTRVAASYEALPEGRDDLGTVHVAQVSGVHVEKLEEKFKFSRILVQIQDLQRFASKLVPTDSSAHGRAPPAAQQAAAAPTPAHPSGPPGSSTPHRQPANSSTPAAAPAQHRQAGGTPAPAAARGSSGRPGAAVAGQQQQR
ncbi:hypothetical protein B0J18DRAFT_474234 [Chaetomium sp. MPI-SDFR-AT-0129]|nr:hypothetical protein B0J18DRAFT_474234 [Chaetomium sp. MPI-SDFR-AT-0129]